MKRQRRRKYRVTAMFTILALASSAMAQNSLAPANLSVPRPTGLTYADTADLALASRIVAAVRVRQATRLKGAEAATVMQGRRRFLVQAEVLALIRAVEGIAPRITYVIDVAPDASGKFPKLGRGEAVIFATPVPGYPGEMRLVSPDGQIAATPDNLARIRSILKEAENPSSAPAIASVGNAFHTQGAIPGESETQIFLQAADDREISVSVVRSPGATPTMSVSLGEVVDQGAGIPQRNSLTWYRLACFLPPVIPQTSVESLSDAEAATVREDYALIIKGLGTCPRSLRIRPGT